MIRLSFSCDPTHLAKGQPGTSLPATLAGREKVNQRACAHPVAARGKHQLPGQIARISCMGNLI